MATTPKDFSKELNGNRFKCSAETKTRMSEQLLSILTELWYRGNGQSTIDMAQTLDEVGVEKYLPGAAEVFSGTLSLLRTSLPPCSRRPRSPLVIIAKPIGEVLTLFLALHHSGRPGLCETLITCGWPKQVSSQLLPRVSLLARAFNYADLRIPLAERQWTLLEQFQSKFYQLNKTLH